MLPRLERGEGTPSLPRFIFDGPRTRPTWIFELTLDVKLEIDSIRAMGIRKRIDDESKDMRRNRFMVVAPYFFLAKSFLEKLFGRFT